MSYVDYLNDLVVLFMALFYGNIIRDTKYEKLYLYINISILK